VEAGTLAHLPTLPAAIDATTTARWIEAVLKNQVATPEPLTRQVELLMRAFARLSGAPTTLNGAQPPAAAADSR